MAELRLARGLLAPSICLSGTQKRRLSTSKVFCKDARDSFAVRKFHSLLLTHTNPHALSFSGFFPRWRHVVQARRRRSGSEEDDEPENLDIEEDEEWLAEVEANEIVLDEDDFAKFTSEEEEEDTSETVPYISPEDGDDRDVQKPKWKEDTDPRMKINTRDGSRWDEAGVDRLKFVWEKSLYEVPEIHESPEMLALRKEAEERHAIREGAKPPERPTDIDKWLDEYVEHWSQLMGADAWQILEEYYPTPEEEEQEAKRKQRLEQIESPETPQELKLQLEKEEEDYKKQEEQNPPNYRVEPETGRKVLYPVDVVNRWRTARAFLKKERPDYAEIFLVADRDFVNQVNRANPIVPTPLKTEEVLDRWQARALQEKKRRKEREHEEYLQSQRELGSSPEYNCLATNDVRLKPLDGCQVEEWTEEEIMALITNNGRSPSPEKVMNMSLTIVNPKARCDHVQDYGVKYVPSMEESIEALGKFMPIDHVDYPANEPVLLDDQFTEFGDLSDIPEVSDEDYQESGIEEDDGYEDDNDD